MWVCTLLASLFLCPFLPRTPGYSLPSFRLLFHCSFSCSIGPPRSSLFLWVSELRCLSPFLSQSADCTEPHIATRACLSLSSLFLIFPVVCLPPPPPSPLTHSAYAHTAMCMSTNTLGCMHQVEGHCTATFTGAPNRHSDGGLGEADDVQEF